MELELILKGYGARNKQKEGFGFGVILWREWRFIDWFARKAFNNFQIILRQTKVKYIPIVKIQPRTLPLFYLFITICSLLRTLSRNSFLSFPLKTQNSHGGRKMIVRVSQTSRVFTFMAAELVKIWSNYWFEWGF